MLCSSYSQVRSKRCPCLLPSHLLPYLVLDVLARDCGLQSSAQATVQAFNYKFCWPLQDHYSPPLPTPSHRPASPAARNLVAFYHAAMGSPYVRTLIASLDRGHVQLPGLTSSLLRKYPPDTTSSDNKGTSPRLVMARHGVRPTSAPQQHSEQDDTVIQRSPHGRRPMALLSSPNS
jgi:hypothetical protein